MTDWHRWHDDYNNPQSSLSRRLVVVQRLLRGALFGAGAPRVLSLCAGDGRDVIPVLAELGLGGRAQATLVEIDPVLAASARQRAAGASVPVEVVVADAGACSTWAHALPVDVLMLCGIFGNISDDDVRLTINHAPNLLAPSGVVVWTRGGRPGADLRPQIRQWWQRAGLDEVSFDQEDSGYGVGMNRLTRPPVAAAPALPTRLFTFIR